MIYEKTLCFVSFLEEEENFFVSFVVARCNRRKEAMKIVSDFMANSVKRVFVNRSKSVESNAEVKLRLIYDLTVKHF
jgi:hypothetical protein